MKSVSWRRMAASFSVLAAVGFTSPAFADNQVPIKGQFATEFAITAMQFPLPPPNNTVPIVTVTVKGAGQVSHLGRTACISTDETVDFTKGGKLTGKLTLTAANNDTLIAEMDAWATPDGDVLNFAGTLTFTGGTGRFTNATGTAAFEGGASPIQGPTGVGWFSFKGLVSSPGASKK